MIKISKLVLRQMIAHSLALKPIESCGYLAGTAGNISKSYAMDNVDNSPEHFTFDPKEQFQVLKAAREEGLQLLGVYHSHPESPARLSEEDLRLLNDPNMTYFIVSLMEKSPDVKAYKVKKEDQTIHVESVEIQEY